MLKHWHFYISPFITMWDICFKNNEDKFERLKKMNKMSKTCQEKSIKEKRKFKYFTFYISGFPIGA